MHNQNIMLSQVNKTYLSLLSDLLKAPVVNGTRELLNRQFVVNPYLNIIHVRKPSLKYILAETIWYFSKSDSSEWIGQFAKLWNNITDDGVTSNSAYGYILFKKHGFDQVEQAIEILKNDASSRRAFVNINIPHSNKMHTKDEPCTIGLQFYIRDGKLYATGIMRSNDVWFGLPYDIIFFTELQKYVARRLGVLAGLYTHFVVSLHMYERDKEKVEEIVNGNKSDIELYHIDFSTLISQADELYTIVNKENILDICNERNIIL